MKTVNDKKLASRNWRQEIGVKKAASDDNVRRLGDSRPTRPHALVAIIEHAYAKARADRDPN